MLRTNKFRFGTVYCILRSRFSTPLMDKYQGGGKFYYIDGYTSVWSGPEIITKIDLNSREILYSIYYVCRCIYYMLIEFSKGFVNILSPVNSQSIMDPFANTKEVWIQEELILHFKNDTHSIDWHWTSHQESRFVQTKNNQIINYGQIKRAYSSHCVW